MMRNFITIMRCLGMFWIGMVILCLIFYKSFLPLQQLRITGWNCEVLIYEDSRGQTFECNLDGRFVPVGRTNNLLKGDKK